MKMSVKVKKITIWSLSGLLFLFLVLGLSGVLTPNPTANPQIAQLSGVQMEDYYSEYLAVYDQTFNKTDDIYVKDASSFILEVDEVLDDTNTYYLFEESKEITIEIDVENRGLYHVSFDYLSEQNIHLPMTVEVRLNGSLTVPYYEASQITLNTLWKEIDEEIPVDRYGNDVSIAQEPYAIWQEVRLRDARRLYQDGLSFYLNEGINTMTFMMVEGQLKLREIKLFMQESLPSYDDYIDDYQKGVLNEVLKIEAEESYYRNSSSIVRGISRDPLIEPFSMTKLKLNVLGTESYDVPGDAVSWEVDVPTSGLYHITLKGQQLRQNATVYRTLYINGEIPFEEARHLGFTYSRDWQNMTLSTFDQEPLLIYLNPGDRITLEVDATLFSSVYEKLLMITQEMTALGLDITKLTRNNTDRGIDWDMIAYFPDLYEKLDQWMTDLEEVNDVMRSLYGFDRDAQTIRDIEASISKLKTLRGDINEIPRRLTLLSTGSSSAVQLISNQLDSLLKQPLIVDALYIHTEDQDLPQAKANIFQNLRVGVARFFLSFIDQSYAEKADEDELEIWVNRSRQYVDLIQKVADDKFTEATGIKVKISLISDDSKLLLANSADQQPDVAMGISAWIPNEYGMRGMLYDMSQSSDFSDVISVFNPEQLIPMTYSNQLFGLPETENFFVLFYRRDILEQLSLTVPNTWDDVLGMLPVLRRYGMSFYVPLSNSSALKSFDATAPFIHQFGGSIYASDGLSSGLDQDETIEAITFMTDLYREYAMPYQVPSFFNSFRYASIPIGIGDFGMYLQLMNAASDIRGLWEIALVPGIEHEVYNPSSGMTETVINRSMGGAQQASIIFEKSEKKEEAWAFLSWWMSTETQSYFADTLINTLGTRYLWNSANLEAFANLRWNEEHKAIILEQWTHLKEVPKIPGSYIIERELSNTWTSVVYEDANLRSSVSDAIIKINKEVERKMIEFGYLDRQGNIIKPFILPTKEDILRWYDND
ncbi:MAG: extracellular solute-binding protein [Acholeplasmataceae bacterium]|jgi:ABC-type glycerol-3-phosphate transport system substrate-binding protein|nr:extracellular solute-binding protein [Acholeplasmataceae bacterium]